MDSLLFPDENERARANIRDLLKDWFDIAVQKGDIQGDLQKNSNDELRNEGNKWYEHYKNVEKEPFGHFTPQLAKKAIEEFIEDIRKNRIKGDDLISDENVYGDLLNGKESAKVEAEQLLDDFIAIQ